MEKETEYTLPLTPGPIGPRTKQMLEKKWGWEGWSFSLSGTQSYNQPRLCWVEFWGEKKELKLTCNIRLDLVLVFPLSSANSHEGGINKYSPSGNQSMLTGFPLIKLTLHSKGIYMISGKEAFQVPDTTIVVWTRSCSIVKWRMGY